MFLIFNKFIITLGSFLFIGCAHLIDKTAEEKLYFSPSPQVQEESQIKKAFQLLESEKYTEATEAMSQFINEHPQSQYFLSARLGLAQSLDGLGRFSEAQAIYRNIYTSQIGLNNEVAILALYESAYSYEQSGDEAQALAALMDTQRYVRYLKKETATAEIPARISMIYAKMRRSEDAQRYFKQARNELNRILHEHRRSQDPDWLSQVYYQMAGASVVQLSASNLSSTIEGQRQVLPYLMKSMSYGGSQWAKKSYDRSVSQYRNIWSAIQNTPMVSGIEAQTALRIVRDFQISKGAEFLNLIEYAELLKPIDELSMNPIERDFFVFIEILKKEVNEVLYKTSETTILSEESKKQYDIKRNIKILDDFFYRPVIGKDPNL